MKNPFKRDLKQSMNHDDHILGDLHSKVHIVIYADFADPEFPRLHHLVKEIVRSLGDKVAIAYRYWPDSAKHPQAKMLAQAVEVAAMHNKCWEMIDVLAANHAQLGDDLRPHAEAIGLDVAQFESGLNSEDVRKRIDHDHQTAEKSHVEESPGIFINNVHHHQLSMHYIYELTQTGGTTMG